MAETFPETLINVPNVTKGEIRIFDLLKNVLNDEEFIVWFEPKIETKIGKSLYPDIIVWSRVTGLLILEIKDWVIKDILEWDPNTIKMKKGAETVKLPNPECQVRNYVNSAMNSLKKVRDFVEHEGKRKGGLKFPIGYGVVLTTSKEQLESSGMNKVIKCETLTSDEIEKIEVEGKSIILVSKLRKMGNLFPFEALSNKELDMLRAVLFPRIIIPQMMEKTEELAMVAESKEREVDFETVKVLDKHQEKIAISLGAGHRIIKGTAGSGKTLLLAYRAITIKKFMPKYRILILCYNITLRNYIRDLLDALGKEDNIKTDEIEVHYFHDFVYKKIGIPQLRGKIDKKIMDKVFDFHTDWDTYQNFLGSLLMDNINFIPKEQYDAIFVDECQDLTTNYIKFIVHLLNKDTDHLLIAIDPAQNLYGGKIVWKSVGVNAKGRVSTLQTSYRNTKNILNLALKFNNQKVIKLTPDDSDLPLFPDNTDRIGSMPKLIEFDNTDLLTNYIAAEIKEQMKIYNFKYSDFGVIFPIKPEAILINLKKLFNEQGIKFEHIDNKLDKTKFEINKDSCKILNTYIVKGYEFKVVFLLNLEKYSSLNSDESLKRNNVFVGLTRAMNDLQILAVKQPKEAKFITEIKAILKEMK